eukprot:TRINITY_DN17828_c0_g1_i3.p1 TRINITY_DN17828_c0_g1~~TRINITY_DN17828_c0_g1_i3.p1  ORF type:complete len:120 (+),score=24.35 TRINITY_DN17828_c0_g1_i3:364-723(+)
MVTEVETHPKELQAKRQLQWRRKPKARSSKNSGCGSSQPIHPSSNVLYVLGIVEKQLHVRLTEPSTSPINCSGSCGSAQFTWMIEQIVGTQSSTCWKCIWDRALRDKVMIGAQKQESKG